jgi:hypothetical protein
MTLDVEFDAFMLDLASDGAEESFTHVNNFPVGEMSIFDEVWLHLRSLLMTSVSDNRPTDLILWMATSTSSLSI